MINRSRRMKEVKVNFVCRSQVFVEVSQEELDFIKQKGYLPDSVIERGEEEVDLKGAEWDLDDNYPYEIEE